ncbi:MarR family winged helix-turn-helix transcriptional regulator [Desulfovibrio sp. OttesenSCG-928-C06]|nr:MarR family winged helix-turn-helix transcriptional regulator [Desulfovibrio sp. OttesenSCG-928-C06]MDL2307780.1 MarR family winged helix-turn-helix transcriptional regulator [Desulfovibrio sp. OttesenSCG-928-C06]
MLEHDNIPIMPCICGSMRRATQKLKEFYDNILAPSGVTASQYSLLLHLSRMEGCCTGELAQAVRREKSTLVRNLAPLLKAGYIEDRSLQGSRTRQLHLSKEGHSVLEQAHPLWRQAQSDLLARLGGEDSKLREVLGVFENL